MKVSHILYKVDDLQKAVQDFRNQGFTVEYGKKKNPYNALIYFEEGPYIELIYDMNMPILIQRLLRFFGQSQFVESIMSQKKEDEGYIRLAFEAELNEFKSLRKKYKQWEYRSIVVPVKRKDYHQYLLKCKCIFPYDSKLPFVKSPFETTRIFSPNHKNNIKCIKHITYKVDPEQYDLVNSMNSDSLLDVSKGDFEINVEF